MERPKPGAAEPACRRTIALAEGLEDRTLFIGRNADAGIAHREVQNALLADLLEAIDAHEDFTLFGKFDGVAQQVQNNLPQPSGVAQQAGGHLGRHVTDQFQSFSCRGHGHETCGIFDHVICRHGNRFQFQAARFDL